VDRGGQEIDKGVSPRFVTEEVNGGFAGEGVAVPGEVERDVVEGGVNQLGPLSGFLARQVVRRVHVLVRVTATSLVRWLLEQQALEASSRQQEAGQAQHHQVADVE